MGHKLKSCRRDLKGHKVLGKQQCFPEKTATVYISENIHKVLRIKEQELWSQAEFGFESHFDILV